MIKIAKFVFAKMSPSRDSLMIAIKCPILLPIFYTPRFQANRQIRTYIGPQYIHLHWRRNDLYFGGAHSISCAIHVQYINLFSI